MQKEEQKDFSVGCSCVFTVSNTGSQKIQRFYSPAIKQLFIFSP